MDLLLDKTPPPEIALRGHRYWWARGFSLLAVVLVGTLIVVDVRVIDDVLAERKISVLSTTDVVREFSTPNREGSPAEERLLVARFVADGTAAHELLAAVPPAKTWLCIQVCMEVAYQRALLLKDYECNRYLRRCADDIALDGLAEQKLKVIGARSINFASGRSYETTCYGPHWYQFSVHYDWPQSVLKDLERRVRYGRLERRVQKLVLMPDKAGSPSATTKCNSFRLLAHMIAEEDAWSAVRYALGVTQGLNGEERRRPVALNQQQRIAQELGFPNLDLLVAAHDGPSRPQCPSDDGPWALNLYPKKPSTTPKRPGVALQFDVERVGQTQ